MGVVNGGGGGTGESGGRTWGPVSAFEFDERGVGVCRAEDAGREHCAGGGDFLLRVVERRNVVDCARRDHGGWGDCCGLWRATVHFVVCEYRETEDVSWGTRDTVDAANNEILVQWIC